MSPNSRPHDPDLPRKQVGRFQLCARIMKLNISTKTNFVTRESLFWWTGLDWKHFSAYTSIDVTAYRSRVTYELRIWPTSSLRWLIQHHPRNQIVWSSNSLREGGQCGVKPFFSQPHTRYKWLTSLFFHQPENYVLFAWQSDFAYAWVQYLTHSLRALNLNIVIPFHC